MESDAERFSEVAARCAESSDEAVSAMQKLVANLKATKRDKEGLSLLKVKNYEMVAYLSELTILMSKMLKGDSIQMEGATKRALKHRVILEKVRPIEDKMKPQIEKLLSRKSGEAQKTNLRVRLENMDVGDDGEDDEEDGDEDGEKSESVKKYVAPKIRAVRYEDEEEAPTKQVEKAKRRAMQSSLILELKNQYSDAPEEIREVSEKKYQYDREREKYEEDNFTRVRMTKEQQRKSEKLGRAETLDDLLSFGDYMMRSEDGKSALNLKRKRLSSGASGAPKKKKTQKERKKAAKSKKEGKKRAIRRRQ